MLSENKMIEIIVTAAIMILIIRSSFIFSNVSSLFSGFNKCLLHINYMISIYPIVASSLTATYLHNIETI